MAHTQQATEAPAESSHAQADDIQVGFIAALTCLFAAFLLVSLIGLEAFFYNAANAEAVRNMELVPQGGPTTELGKANAQWNTMLHANGNVPNVVAVGKEDPMGKMVYPKINVQPIDSAMDDVVKQYATAPASATKGPAK
jgi:hypothetical protein